MKKYQKPLHISALETLSETSQGVNPLACFPIAKNCTVNCILSCGQNPPNPYDW